jgi:membrane carboxypeptidase/penicillin-binding protein
MKRAIGWIAAELALLIALYAVWLGWRIADQRAKAPAAVAAILAKADPAVDEISDERIAMLLEVEDPTFWTNDGIDLRTPGAGMTTLSQGLGKLVMFRSFSPGFLRLGKLELMTLTRFALVPTVSKDDILRAMLASAYLGSDEQGAVIGFPEGARRWFGKELGALTDDEFIALFAMLPAPNRLDPLRHPAESAERVARIKRLIANACEPIDVEDVDLEGCAAA